MSTKRNVDEILEASIGAETDTLTKLQEFEDIMTRIGKIDPTVPMAPVPSGIWCKQKCRLKEQKTAKLR